MHITTQSHFNKFSCIAAECPESCCKFWQIYADDDALKKYYERSAEDERIRKIVQTEEGCFAQVNGICGFLDGDELCYLQKLYGEEMLCDTCRNYPRHIEEFENVREFSLSLSCPEAARMILTDPEPMRFEDTENNLEEEYEEFDCLLYDNLLDIRDFLYEIAQNRSISINRRLDLLSAFALEYQKLLEAGGLFESEDLTEQYRKRILANEGKEETDTVFDSKELNALFTLEILHEDWKEKLIRAFKMFERADNELPDGFDRFVKNTEAAAEQILMHFLFTYFCGAVYDGWAGPKIMLAVYSVKWILMIAFSEGGTGADLLKTAWQTAREIEHSDPNIEKLEEWFIDQHERKL